MLFKLSLGNIRKSLRDHAIYFFTLMIGVAVFYVFNAIETQTAFIIVSSDTRRMIELMTSLLSGVSVFVSAVLGGLIVYASRFLMRRRNKEFALYMLLGMSKGRVSAILLTETLIIGAVSLGAGLLLGVGLSQLMSAFTVSLFDADMTSFGFKFSADAAVKTVIYFALIYVVTMLFNTVIVGRFRLIDLMRSDKRSESQKLKNPLVCVIVFLVGAAMLGYAYYKVAFDTFNIENSAEMLLYIAMGSVSTFLIFLSVSGMMTRILTASKKLYYKELNCFTFRQIGSRINTMVVSASIICLMLFVTVCTLAAAFSLKNSLEDNIGKYAPVDLCVETFGTEDVMSDTDIKELYGWIGVDLDEYLSEYVQFTEYNLNDFTGADFFGEYLESARKKSNTVNIADISENLIHLSEYNRLAGLYGFETLDVPDGCYAVVCNFDEMTRVRNLPLAAGNEITVQGNILRPAYSECKDGLDMISNNAMNLGLIVIPDALMLEADTQQNYISGNYKAETMKEKRETEKHFADSDMSLLDAIKEHTDESFAVFVNTRIQVMDSAVGLGAAATLIGLYIGIVFLISCGAILSIKALSENIDSLSSYDVLRKIGADEKDINRSLFRQTGVFFLLPLLLACIHSIFGIKFAATVFEAFGTTGLLPAMLATAVIVIVIYGGYFLITYYCGKGIIRTK